MKNSLFGSLFLVNLMFSIICVFKSYYVWPFIVQKWGFGTTPRRCGIFHLKTQTLMQKNLSFIVSGTLTCVRLPVYAYTCMKHTYKELEHACANACMRSMT